MNSNLGNYLVAPCMAFTCSLTHHHWQYWHFIGPWFDRQHPSPYELCGQPTSVAGILSWGQEVVGTFRSLFLVRYYINGFESAAMFEPHSKPSSRTMTGLPITGIRRGASQYGSLGRKPAPEILRYVLPFSCWHQAVGTIFKSTFEICSLIFFSHS